MGKANRRDRKAMQLILTVISLAGNYLNCRKIRWCFALWIICNIGWGYIDFINASYSRMILDAVQTVFAIYGLKEWKNDCIYKRSHNRATGLHG